MSDPVIRAAELDQITWEAMRQFQVMMIGAMGDDSQIENRCLAGECVVSALGSQTIVPDDVGHVSDWTFPNQLKLPADADIEPSAELVAEIEAVFEDKIFGLVPVRWVQETLIKAISGAAEKTLETLMTKALEAVSKGKPGGYIFTTIAGKIPSIAQKVTNEAVAKVLKRAVKASNRRRGIQIISTRKQLVGYGWLKFSGMWAYRARRGRQPLPTKVWVARYKARLAARNKTGRHRPGKGVTVPQTKNGRPKAIVNLASGRKTIKSFGETKPTISEVIKVIGDYGIEKDLRDSWESKRRQLGL
jgi:hypothetical protein